MHKYKAGGIALLVSGMAAVSIGLAGPANAAAPTPIPSPTCKVPSLTITPNAGSAGVSVTVTGANFSGCKLKTGTVVPTPVLPVKVGLVDANKKSVVLSTVNTTATGTFTTTITIPNLVAGAKVGVAAASVDPATKLDYAAVLPFTYTGTSGTSVPTAVPAGLGHGAATTSDATHDAELGLVGLGGLLVLGGAGLALRRRGDHS